MILVHGWNSHPGIWNRLGARYKKAGIPCRNFDHTGMRGSAISEISKSFSYYIRDVRDENNWYGPVDIVCHSLGSLIVRHLLEVVDGKERNQAVRQLITISSSNTGSTLAELHYDKKIFHQGPQGTHRYVSSRRGLNLPETICYRKPDLQVSSCMISARQG